MQDCEPAAGVVQSEVGSGALGQLRVLNSLMAAEQAGEVLRDAGCIVGRCLVVCMATALGSAESDARGNEGLGCCPQWSIIDNLKLELPPEVAKN